MKTTDLGILGRVPNIFLWALAIYILVAAYGQFHYLLPWHNAENVLIGDNTAANQFEATKPAYLENTTAESRGVYKDDSELDAYVIGADGQTEEVHPW